MGRVTGLVGVVVLLAGPLACSGKSASEEAVGVRHAALTESYTVRLGSGVTLLQNAIVTDGVLTIDDQVTIKDAEGAPAAISNSGTLLTHIGVEAKVGTVRSEARLDLANRAQILGDARTGGTITKAPDAIIAGTQAPNTSIAPFTTETVSADFGGTSGGDVLLEPPSGSAERVTTLAPGTYGRLVVKSRNRVNLTGGVYNFSDFQLEPEGRLVLSDADQGVRLNVKTTLLFKGAVQSVSGEQPAFRLLYVGTAATVIESAFAGVLIAPRASVRLATPIPFAAHIGAFFAKNLEVSAGATVIFKPAVHYDATQTWSASSTEFGGFGLGASLDNGGVLFISQNHAFRFDGTGVATTLVPAGTDHRPFIDRSSGRWGYRTAAGTFRALRADGTVIGEYPIDLASVPFFIPGAEKALVLVARPNREGEPFAAASVIDFPSGTTSSFEVPDLRWGEASPTRIVYTTKTQLVGANLSGTQQWAKTLPLRDLRLADSGNVLIGVRADKPSSIVHVDPANGNLLSELALPSAVWEIGTSRNGVRSFAATKNELFVFKGGVLERRIKPPITYFASAEVNDAGELVVGGKQANFEGRLLMRGPAGTDPWQQVGSADDQGYRPFVFFQRADAGFFVVRKGGVASYAIARRL